MTLQAYSGAQIFDGEILHQDRVLLVEAGRVRALLPEVPPGCPVTQLSGGYLLPGLIDLQVNGGGGDMVGPATDAAQLARICAAHGRLGSTGLMPTLITDTPEVTARVLAAGRAALGCPGFLGLHLEGPHLDPRRAGAHDPALIRPLDEVDVTRLLEARAAGLRLLLTLAPAAASLEQITRLSAAGIIISLGHAEARASEAAAALAAGARMGTHLFNAMSPLGHREPGMVGALLDSQAWLGIIADGHHIAPSVLRLALAARPSGVFLVTDAMAVAGTPATEFPLNGRRVLRRDGRLVLEDGTLAGADLSLPQAIAVLINDVGLAPERAFAMASAIPARALGLEGGEGHLRPGGPADFVHLTAGFALTAVWRGAERLD